MIETVSQIGEFGLIDRIHELIQREGVEARGEDSLGMGDDCAVLAARPGYDVLVTCDCVVEGRHYLPQYTSPFDLGRRAMALNISDIGAMGGRPLYAVISLGLTPDTRIADVEAMYSGFVSELNPFGAAIMGGNITQSGDGLFTDITLIGEIQKGCAVRRSTARAGDVVLVTGYPGESGAGLALLLKQGRSADLTDHPLVKAYTRPSHRAREGYAAADSGLATAMIDISDGLLGDLGHICTESGLGAHLFEAKLPLREPLQAFAQERRMRPYEAVLQESDDYELIITVPPQEARRFCSVIAEISGVPVHEIGTMTPKAGELTLSLVDGTRKDMGTAGWDHLKQLKAGARIEA
ncbi:MAG: thiamine-phosphate kinase [Desulfobacteraceae bacterium]